MKKLLLITLTLFTYLSYGQTEQGKFIIGATSSFGFTSSKIEDADDSQVSLDFSPQAGYFIIDNLSVGLSTEIETFWEGDFTQSSFQIGPFARYYFLEERIRPYIQAGYLFGSFKQEIDDEETFKQTTGTFDITGGASLFLNNIIAIDAQFSYQTGRIDPDFEGAEKFNFSGFGLNLGFSLFL